MFDRLQASYEDVNFELDVMRASPDHRHSAAVMLGGDSLHELRHSFALAEQERDGATITARLSGDCVNSKCTTQRVLLAGCLL